MRLEVAVVGAGGQIGSVVLGRFMEISGLDCWGVVRNALTAGPLRDRGLAVRVGDVSDPSARSEVLGTARIVVNLSSASGLGGTARASDRAVLHGLLDHPSVRHVIHLSSVAVYGGYVDLDRSTFSRPRPTNPYGADKLDLEGYARRLAVKRGKSLAILRLGHVYGPEQWVSKFVFDAAADRFPPLPFDGRRPSNAIHVDQVANALTSAVEQPADGTLNLTGSLTWRQLFDWHTSALGVPRVIGLDDAMSELWEARFAREARTPRPVRVALELSRWAKSLPLSAVQASPSLRDSALSGLSRLQSARLEAEILKRFSIASIDAKVPVRAPVDKDRPWLFSPAVPGPMVSLARAVGPDDQRAVAEWRQISQDPDRLFPVRSTGVAVSPH